MTAGDKLGKSFGRVRLQSTAHRDDPFQPLGTFKVPLGREHPFRLLDAGRSDCCTTLEVLAGTSAAARSESILTFDPNGGRAPASQFWSVTTAVDAGSSVTHDESEVARMLYVLETGSA